MTGGITTPPWLQEALFERRIVFVTGRLDDAVAGHAAAQLTALDAADDRSIQLQLDCPDGTLEAAFVVVDTLDTLRAPVRVHCRGRAGGGALGVVAFARHRSAAPHASFHLAEPRTELTGTPGQLATYARQQEELLRRFQARLVGVTGRPPEAVAHDLRAGRYLDAREALAYGLIDTIVRIPAP
jgi:ATP-dependent Clp protease protease subunit